ncbi:MAG: hypothetical protein QXI12_10475 [Candidatus Methanomethyliaceae archaeon]
MSAIEDLAQKIGVNAGEIKELHTDWPSIMRQGVIVDLYIGRTRCWRSLSAEDLGLVDLGDKEYARFEAEYLDLGRKALLPKAILKRADNIEQNARALLERHSLKTYWGRFVPATAFAAWKAENDRAKAEYFALRDEIGRRYEELVETVLRDYQQAGHKAYQRIRQLAPETAHKISEEAFIANLVAKIKEAIPSKEHLVGSFIYQENIFYIPIPSQVEEELRKAEQIKTARYEEESRRRAIDEMNAEVARFYKEQKKKLIDGFLKDVTVQIRSLLYETSLDVLASIRRNGTLVGRNATQLKILLEKMEQLNILEDPVLEGQIRELKNLLGTGNKRLGELQDVLREIGTISRGLLLNMGEAPRSGREVGIPDVIDPDLVTSLEERRRRKVVQDVSQVAFDFPGQVGRRATSAAI